MDIQSDSKQGCGTAVAKHAPSCCPAPKWAALVDDKPTSAPSQKLLVRVLKHQAGVPADHVLVRDHGTEHDVVLNDDDEIDLVEGNVFYSVPKCDSRPRGGCPAPAKLAFFINDRFEETRRNHTRQSLLDLFGIHSEVTLFRDRVSPDDQPITSDSRITYDDGPVFVTRGGEPSSTVQITINGDKYQIRPGKHSVSAIKQTAIPPVPPEDILSQVIDKKLVPLAADGSVLVKGCEVFVSNCPSGGAS